MTDKREELIEGATWNLIEWDADTSDWGVSAEHYRERRADVERVWGFFEQAHTPTIDGQFLEGLAAARRAPCIRSVPVSVIPCCATPTEAHAKPVDTSPERVKNGAYSFTVPSVEVSDGHSPSVTGSDGSDTPTDDEREALVDAVQSVVDPPKSCQIDGCRHYARYLDSGDAEWCACHYFNEGHALAAECKGQPVPAPPRSERVAEAVIAAGFRRTVQGEPTDAALDAAFAAFRAHDRGEQFNELGEHVCSECGYAYSWPSGVDGRQEVPARRRQRHIAREALRAARFTSWLAPTAAQVEEAAKTLANRMMDGPWEDLLDTLQEDYRHDARAALRAAARVEQEGAQ